MDVYDRIDMILKERRMSRRQLAIAAGIPESSFAAAFSRRSKMVLENLEKIARVLEVSPGDLEPSIKPLIEIAEDNSIMVDYYERQTAIIEYMSVVNAEMKENRLLDRFHFKDEAKQNLLYSILSCALILNKDGLNKVVEYMLDTSKIIEYQDVGARIVSKKVHNAIREVDIWPEDVPPTAAEHNPGSDQTGAGK